SFPWFGTLGNKKEIADEAAKAAYKKYQSQKLRLFYQVKAAYYDYYILSREIELTKDNMELLKYWESVARTRYKAGLTGHHNVIKAQVELGKLENRLTSLEEMKTPLASRLKAAVNLPDFSTAAVPDSIPQSDLAPDKDALKKAALEGSPDLKEIEHVLRSKESAVRLAGKSYFPDFAVGVDYIEIGESTNPSVRNSGKDAWTVGVSINLPIWLGKNKAKVNEARARRLETEYHLTDAKNNLAALIDKVFYEYEDAAREVELYRGGLIAKAEQSLNATFMAYQVGETDFLNLIDSQRELLDLQLQLEYAMARNSIKLAELEMLIGQNLNVNIELIKKGEIQ
ncbi:MAG: TolC family protein, partial [Candidatus Zixiibacteriota bacterium]